MDENAKIKDFQDRALNAKTEIDVILQRYEVTIAPIFEYKPQGIAVTAELVNIKKYPEDIILPTEKELKDLKNGGKKK